MKCDKVVNLLSPYLDNNLDIENKYQIKMHLEQCKECRQTYKALSKMKKHLEKVNNPKSKLNSNFIDTIKEKAKDDKVKLKILPYQIKNIVVTVSAFLLFALLIGILINTNILNNKIISEKNVVILSPSQINEESKNAFSILSDLPKYVEKDPLEPEIFEEFIATLYFLEAMKLKKDKNRTQYLLSQIIELYPESRISDEAKEILTKIGSKN